jgi:protein TonB
MKTNYENTSMLDIVFEHRNKSYGAYVLRRDYNKSLLQAAMIATSIIVMLIGGQFIKDHLSGSTRNYAPEVILDFTELDVQIAPKIEPPKVEEKLPAEAMAKATIENPEKRVVKETGAIADTIATADILKQYDSGLTTNLNGDPNLGVTDGKGTNPTLDQPVKTVATAPEIVLIPDVMPEFPGGEAALFKFLGKHTQYPDREKELSIEGKATVKFVVNADGSISNVSVIRTDSPGFGNESMRVVGMMPKFKPGMQNGHPVRVQYVLPFKYRLNH